MTTWDMPDMLNEDEHGVPYSSQNPLGFTFPQGKVVLQYDPGDHTQQASSEIWVEDRSEPVLRKTWPAIPGIQTDEQIASGPKEATGGEASLQK